MMFTLYEVIAAIAVVLIGCIFIIAWILDRRPVRYAARAPYRIKPAPIVVSKEQWAPIAKEKTK